MTRKIAIIVLLAATTFAASAQANEPYFPRREKSFTRLDANKDGKIARTEFGTVVARRFARMDLNADKSITAAELDQMMTKAIERRKARIMLLLDRDKNGSITEAELDAIVDSMFTAADTDTDGALTLAEMQNFKRAPWRKGLMGTQPEVNPN